MKKPTFVNILKLLGVCFIALIVMQLTSIMIYTAMTEGQLTQHIAEFVSSHHNISKDNFHLAYEKFSSPILAKFLDILMQGGILFTVGYLIDRRELYGRRYWMFALLISQVEHNLTSSNISFTPNMVMHILIILSALLVGIAALYLSVILAERQNTLSRSTKGGLGG